MSEREYQEALRRDLIRDIAKICREYDEEFQNGEEDAEDSFIRIYDIMYEYGYIYGANE